MSVRRLVAQPFDLELDPATAALVVIDMQRDFLEPRGFGALLGNDVSLLRGAIAPTRAVLEAARRTRLLVVHTREGHRPDLSDCPPAKLVRGGRRVIGTEGPMGRVLVRGQPGHDIVDELRPVAGEPVVDKPGKGAFYRTDLELMLHNRGIRTLLVCGVTLDVCVHTTVREANDRGFECVVLADCVASYLPHLYTAGLEMITAQGALLGWVSHSGEAIEALRAR